jgi:hypothetical protein
MRVRAPAIFPHDTMPEWPPQPRGEGIDLEVAGIRPLEAVHVVPLQLIDRLRTARNAAARPVTLQAPPPADAPVIVHAPGDRLFRQELDTLHQLPVRRREDEPE